MIVAITGANRGIGLELTKKYAQKGHKVFALCRHKSPELENIEGVSIVEDIDVADRALGQALEKGLGGEKVDVFINNAGIMRADNLENLDLEDVREQMEVNAVGPLNAVLHMLPHLKEGSKIGVLTSRMGSIGDNNSGGMYGYRASKAAANAACRSLAMDLKGKGVPVGILHPGYVKTDMTSHQGNINPDEAAEGLYQVMEKLNVDNTGRFWHSNGSELPW